MDDQLSADAIVERFAHLDVNRAKRTRRSASNERTKTSDR
jgi:hypothetical protein